MLPVPPKLRFHGNTPAAKEFTKFALSQLEILKNQMSFQGLKQGSRRVSPFEGVIVECVSKFGLHTVNVFVEPSVIQQPNWTSKKYLKAKSTKLKLEKEKYFIFAKCGPVKQVLTVAVINGAISITFEKTDLVVLSITDIELQSLSCFSQVRYSVFNLRASVIRYGINCFITKTPTLSTSRLGFEVIGESGVPSKTYALGACSIDLDRNPPILYSAHKNLHEPTKFYVDKYKLKPTYWDNTISRNVSIPSPPDSTSGYAFTDFVVAKNGDVSTLVLSSEINIDMDPESAVSTSYEATWSHTGGGFNLDRQWHNQRTISYKYSIDSNIFSFCNKANGAIIVDSDFYVVSTDVDKTVTVNDIEHQVFTWEASGDIFLPAEEGYTTTSHNVITIWRFEHDFYPIKVKDIVIQNSYGSVSKIDTTAHVDLYNNVWNSSDVYNTITIATNGDTRIDDLVYTVYTESAHSTTSAYTPVGPGGYPIVLPEPTLYEYSSGSESLVDLPDEPDELGGKNLIDGVTTKFTYPNSNTVKTSYPPQVSVHYPFNINGVYQILRSFTSHDQESGITFNGIKYSKVKNLNSPQSPTIHWEIKITIPDLGTFDITNTIMSAFEDPLDLTPNYSFLNKFEAIYFYYIENENLYTVPGVQEDLYQP